MRNVAFILQFLSPFIFALILFIIAAIWICIWAVHYTRKEQTCNPSKSKRKIKCEAIFWGFLKYMIYCCSKNNHSSRRNHESLDLWHQEIKEFKRQCEITALKSKPCKAKLPEMPDWKCTCGRINLAHTATCVCGKNMREIPVEIRANISEDELSWHCLCGLKHAGHISICSCGRKKKDVPLAVQAPTNHDPGVWNCSCGRENPGYTHTCVCGKSKRNT